MRRLLVLALLTAVAPWVNAQHTSTASHFARSGHHSGHPRVSLNPLAFYDYPDFLSTAEYSPTAPPVIVVQSAPPSADVSERTSTSPPADPLLIELQGDRYVRVTNSDTPQSERIDHAPSAARQPNSLRPLASKPATAVILFRDGHREEISNYTIAGSVLYVPADYYSSGSWTRRIELSSLNLPATVEANRSRGFQFRLPASPNEVILGP